MRHRTSDRLEQLALRLQVDAGCPPVQYESEALLQALVDLQLEACGRIPARHCSLLGSARGLSPRYALATLLGRRWFDA